MTAFVALLRAVNVGRRQLRMADLKAIGTELALGAARTFIASGNLLFTSSLDEADLRATLEKRLGRAYGRRRSGHGSKRGGDGGDRCGKPLRG
jgi:uncharacterized protein (DUF1697 family)